MGHFTTTATVTSVGGIDVTNPYVLWHPFPDYKSNDVKYKFYFYATEALMNADNPFLTQDFGGSKVDSSIDLSDNNNWSNMRAKAEEILEGLIGDNTVTYVS